MFIKCLKKNLNNVGYPSIKEILFWVRKNKFQIVKRLTLKLYNIACFIFYNCLLLIANYPKNSFKKAIKAGNMFCLLQFQRVN